MPPESVIFVVVVAVVRIAVLLVAWGSELSRSRERARGLAMLARVIRPGVMVMERGADGGVVVVAAPGRQASEVPSTEDRMGLDELAEL